MPETSQWWLYVVECQDGSWYTGITTDVGRRVDQHNGLLAGGAKYTAPRRPVSLLCKTVCQNRSEASKLEYQLKKMSKTAKKRWVEQQLLNT